MRSTFIDWLTKKAKSDERIILLTADLGYSVVEKFANEFPDRFINVGVAEQNMTGIAAGLASDGMRPYTYSIGIFPTFRCAEQIRNDIDYHNLPVVNSMVGCGVAYGALGYTHHAIQDIALMRSLPNMMIATPADPKEVLEILNWHYLNPKPIYLRMHRSKNPVLHEKNIDLQPGSPIQLNLINKKNNEKNTCIVGIGSILNKVLKMVETNNIPVYSMPLWGQSCRNQFIKELSNFEKIITIEDHLLDGGFSSWVMETAAINNFKGKIIPTTLSLSNVGKVAKEETLLNFLFSDLEKNIAKCND